jgi:hypothetical protein
MGKNNTATETSDLKLDARSLAQGLLLGRRLTVSLSTLTGGDKRRNKTMTREMNALGIGKLDESDYRLSWVLDPAETASYLLARHGETAPDLAATWVKDEGRRPFDAHRTMALVALDNLSPGELLWLHRHGASTGHALYGVDKYGRGATRHEIGDAITYKDLEQATLCVSHAAIMAAYHAAYRDHLRGRCIGGDATAQAIETVCGDRPELAAQSIQNALHGGGGGHFFGGGESQWKAWADPAQWQTLIARREVSLRAEIHEAQERLEQTKQIRAILADLDVPATAAACVEAMVQGTTPPGGLPTLRAAKVAA